MPFYSARNLCPNCAKPIRGDDTACNCCGAVLEPSTPVQRPPLPAGVTGHRGGRVIGLAVVGLLALPFAGAMLSCAGYFGTTGLPNALPLLAIGLGFLACGQFSSVTGVVFAYRDWIGMKAGRVDPAGWGRTVFGGWLAAVSVLLYWWMIGAVIVSLF